MVSLTTSLLIFSLFTSAIMVIRAPELRAAIIVRALTGVRAVIDGGSAYAFTLQVNGAYIWFLGFNFMRSDPARVTRLAAVARPTSAATISPPHSFFI